MVNIYIYIRVYTIVTRVFDSYSFSFILWINNFFFNEILRIIVENEEVPFFFPPLYETS